jgi:hypothetical protein
LQPISPSRTRIAATIIAHPVSLAGLSIVVISPAAMSSLLYSPSGISGHPSAHTIREHGEAAAITSGASVNLPDGRYLVRGPIDRSVLLSIL